MARCSSISQPYDHDLSRMLKLYIGTGIAFMLFPGTLIGVLNLLKISAAHASSSADAAWIQAHGHAQLFGWIGTFILGVGFYAIPRMRMSRFEPWTGWVTWAIWTAGVTLRWAGGMFEWHWHITVPLGASLELVAVLVFVNAVFLTRPRPAAGSDPWRTSVLLIDASAVGLVATVAANLFESFRISSEAAAPLFPYEYDQRFLALATWGFIVPFMWGFSTRWIPPLLGLRKSFKRAMLPALGVLYAGVAMIWFDMPLAGYATVFIACAGFTIAMRIDEPPAKEPKFRGVHESIKFFIRAAYAWLSIAALLAMVSSTRPQPNGYVGASRHALTVGFMVLIVFAVGPRVLPAFIGVRRLWSPNLMFAALALATVGCAIRVSSQVLAYEHISAAAWHWLPLSAVTEMTAVAIFTFNMIMSLTTGTPADTIREMQQAV